MLVFMQSILYSCPILIKLAFSQQILEKNQTSNFMKIRPVATELFHVDGRTDAQIRRR